MIHWTNLHCFNVHNDGYFLHSPLRYVNGVIFEISVARMAYKSFAKFLEAKSRNYFQGLYYQVPNVELERGLVRVSNDRGLSYMFDVVESFSRLDLYLNHLDMDLSEYLGQADTTKMGACVSKTIYPPKKSDFDSEYDSDRVVDYLSLGEEELIKLIYRMKANIENKAKGNSVPDINEPNAENNMPVDTTRGETLVEHDIYINELLTRLMTTNENGKIQDPFIFIEKHADKYPMYDETIRWRLRKPKVCENYVIDGKFKECLTYYALVKDHERGLAKSYEKIVLDSNHGFTVKLGVIVNPDGKTYFDRFYVCFVGLADGWKAGCRKVIKLDGCFLRSRNQGEILTAIGRDRNNHIYSMAWAVVNAENKDN
ncbi:hypothetical protein Tco_1540420 [Tanacetum coccineum]